tara:strand:- start:30 stop:329 length:300 start_codon:yes stop_codon:yes gene_type:complete
MEIPTKEIIEKLMGISQVTVMEEAALEAIKVIEAQALEIQELQLVIVRLREERVADMIDGDIELGHGTDFWAKRRMTAFKAMPEPRVAWEDFKRTWKDH